MVSAGWVGEVCAFTVRDAIAKSITKTILFTTTHRYSQMQGHFINKKLKLK
jgi:hypothetical protein